VTGSRIVTIDWKLVDRLLESGNDGVRVASHLGIHPETFYRRCKQDNGTGFAEYLAIKRKRGESLIIAKQFELAMKGDKTMLIWVGKQLCDQREKPKEDETSDDMLRKLAQFVKDIGTVSGAIEARGSEVENKPSVLDQGSVRQEDNV